MHKKIRYREGGTDPDTGMECWPWVRYAFGLMRVELPTDVYEAARQFFREIKAGESLRLFDVIYITNSVDESRHIGILMNSRWMMHCSGMTNGVARSELTRASWVTLPKQYWRCRVFDYAD